MHFLTKNVEIDPPEAPLVTCSKRFKKIKIQKMMKNTFFDKNVEIDPPEAPLVTCSKKV